VWTGAAVTNTRLWVGYFSADPSASSDPSSLSVVAFRYDTGAGDTLVQCYVSDGTSSLTKVGAVPAPNTVYDFAIRLTNGALNAEFWVNGSQVATFDEDGDGDPLPGSSYCLAGVRLTELSASARSIAWSRMGQACR
jgi:hypothetical protein